MYNEGIVQRRPGIKSQDPRRLEVITQLLNAGYRAAEIGIKLNLSRERIRQLILNQLDWQRLHIPCYLCGEPMETQWGLKHLYHKHCAILANQQANVRAVEKVRLAHNHQRNQPDGEFEEEALAAYAKRGYDVLWMPHLAPFDFVVNGLSVDVKGARLDSRNRWQFGMPWYGENTEMQSRCEIAHLCGKVNGSFQHFVVPAQMIISGSCTLYPLPQLFFCDECGAQFPTEAGLYLHQARWCGHAPNWQQYHNNWWRLESHQEESEVKPMRC